MNEREKILVDNLVEYAVFADQAYQKKKYNTAVTLYFKKICAAIDLYLLRKSNLVPSSHTDRFRILQEKFPEIYELLDKDFPFYQESYNKRMNREAAKVLKDDATRITEMG